ncbi:helix-turn-helix domain-containing protein [uncultured Sphingomonas sp.]|uniref:helix-turn-helix domain-containing protein n=1 Tax=uncultured Sphingomonas sp. TaxID=158754 RepID=UPI0035CB219C
MVNPLNERFGARLRSLRGDRGYSQEQMAELAGLDRSFYGRVERGTQNVALTTLARVAAGLEMSLSEMLAGIQVTPAELAKLPKRGSGNGRKQ